MSDTTKEETQETATQDTQIASTTQDAASTQTTADAQKSTAAQDGPSLDDILKEFEDTQKPSTEQVKSEPKKADEKPASDGALLEIQKTLEHIQYRETRKAVQAVVGRIKGETGLDDTYVEGILDAKAKRDPRIAKAFAERETKPEVWANVEKALTSELTKTFGKRADKQVTESRDAVSAAVRSASTAAKTDEFPSDADVARMSQADFHALQRKQGVLP